MLQSTQLSSALRNEAPKSSLLSNHLFIDSLQTELFRNWQAKRTIDRSLSYNCRSAAVEGCATVKSEPLNEAPPIIAEGPGAKIGGLNSQPALLVREPGGFTSGWS